MEVTEQYLKDLIEFNVNLGIHMERQRIIEILDKLCPKPYLMEIEQEINKEEEE